MATLLQNIPPLVRLNNTQCTLAATHEGQQTIGRIGGKFYRLSGTLTLDTATTGLGGLDTGSLGANQTWNVYLCANSASIVGLVASTAAPSVGPSGFSGRYNLVGRFYTTAASIIDQVISVADPADISSALLSSSGGFQIGSPGSGIGQLTIQGNSSGYYDAAVILKSFYTALPSYRALGVYMNNDFSDHTWYMGTAYTDADTWRVMRKVQTSFDGSASEPSTASTFLALSNTGAAIIGPAGAVNNQFHLFRSGGIALDNGGANSIDTGIGGNCFFDASRNFNRTNTARGGAAFCFALNTSASQSALYLFVNQPSDGTTTAADIVLDVSCQGAWTIGPGAGTAAVGLTHRLQSNGSTIARLRAATGNECELAFDINDVVQYKYSLTSTVFRFMNSAGTINQQLSQNGGTNLFYSDVTAGNAGLLLMKSVGSVGNSDYINFRHTATSASSGSSLHGGIRSNAGNSAFEIFFSSDLRKKENIVTITQALDVLEALRPVTFTWKAEYATGGGRGFIAQEVLEVLPELVGQDAEGYYNMGTAELVPLMVAAIKELKARVEALEA